MKNPPGPDEILSGGEHGYRKLLELRDFLDHRLRRELDLHDPAEVDALAHRLVRLVEELVDELNSHGYEFFRVDYGGDKDYRRSEQSYRHGKDPDSIVLHFIGFSVQVIWPD